MNRELLREPSEQFSPVLTVWYPHWLEGDEWIKLQDELRLLQAAG